VGSLFQLSADVYPRSPAIQLAVQQVPVMATLFISFSTHTTRPFSWHLCKIQSVLIRILYRVLRAI
jgi:hypothetical protein